MIQLPTSRKALFEIFRNGRAPEITEFQGEYLVRLLTTFPSLHGLRHRKAFVRTEQGVTGKNVLFRSFGWGHFFLEERTLPGPEKLKVVVINYDVPENGILTRGIRDMVRAVDGDRVYLGRFNVLVLGKIRFLGYFSLTRIP